MKKTHIDWYHDIETDSDEHPVEAEVEARAVAETPDYARACHDLSERLAQQLDAEALELFLQFERIRNDVADFRARQHFNAGYDAGAAHNLLAAMRGSQQEIPIGVLRIITRSLSMLMEDLSAFEASSGSTS